MQSRCAGFLSVFDEIKFKTQNMTKFFYLLSFHLFEVSRTLVPAPAFSRQKNLWILIIS